MKIDSNAPALTSPKGLPPVDRESPATQPLIEDKASLDSRKPSAKERTLAELSRAKKQENAQAAQTAPPAAAEAPPDAPDMAKLLESYLAKILSDPEAEKKMIQMLAGLNASGQLKPVLMMAAEAATESGSLPPMPEKKRTEMVEQLAGMIDAEFRDHGMTPDTHGQSHKTWDDRGREWLSLVTTSKIPPRGPGEMSAFTEPAFLKEMEALQGAPFLPGNQVTALIDGPASFAERNRLIDGATSSIHMMTWAFYDDETGWDTAKRLAAKHREGLDVQVVVDGQVGERTPHQETLKYLEEQGVNVVRWRNPADPYEGQHRKLMVVDGRAAIAGGLNPGNDYSHMGPADAPKWRDTDVLLEGPAVAECERLFASVAGRKATPAAPAEAGSCRTAVVNHQPKVDAHAMLATMKAIQGASESVDIENAYFIQTPGLRKVMMDALERGVKVRVLTNSAQSIDEQIITAPILRCLPELVKAGAEVYLKKGDTLHSKFMVVDGMYSSVGSYNLHPRSECYEGEMTLNTLDTATAGNLTRAFEKDIAAALRVQTPDQIKVPENAMTIIPARYFFDQL